ncbi:MAG: hypothetical protein K5682_00825 [Lachnospiraceae bacterium]|nr:hypothetical protein [Lachnospiraceae bacterium]
MKKLSLLTGALCALSLTAILGFASTKNVLTDESLPHTYSPASNEAMTPDSDQLPLAYRRQNTSFQLSGSEQMGGMMPGHNSFGPQGMVPQTGPGSSSGLNGEGITLGSGQAPTNLPTPEGNTNNPRIDRQVMDETLQQGELTESSDYDYVYLLGSVSDDQYSEFCTYLEMIDEDILADFEADGWKLILTSADLDDLLFRGQTNGVEGCTYPTQKTIYVHAGEYVYCVIHEMGHYIDTDQGYLSKTPEFAAIFAEEGANLTAYGSTEATEFFAEVYCYSVLDPDTLAEKCPKAYSYLLELLEDIAA